MTTNVEKAVDVLRWLQQKFRGKERTDPHGGDCAAEALEIAILVLEDEELLAGLAERMYEEWGA